MDLVAKSFTPPADVREQPGVRQELREEFARREAARGGEGPRGMAEYAELVPEPKSGALDLDKFPYQREPLYSDEIADVEDAVIKKSTQVGVSTGLWRWAVRQADQYGETVIYFFPTDVHVREFAVTRVDAAIEVSPYLQKRIPQHYVRQQGLKQIGTGWLSLRGVQSKRAVQSVDADALVFDEYDECDPTNIEHAERRISGSRAAGRTPRIRRVGRPSIPGYGIDAEYEESDQRVWLVTCGECGEEQQVTWGDNVRWRTAAGGKKILRPGRDDYHAPKDVREVWRVCRSCEATLENGALYEGRWQAQRAEPGRAPGYFIPRLIVPMTDLKDMVVSSRGRTLAQREVFHNADLGEAWAAEDAQLTDEMIDRACAMGGEALSHYDLRKLITAGVDVASERDLTIRISEHQDDGTRKAIYLGEPEDFEEVAQLIRLFNVGTMVIDSQPERRAARALAEEFRGRVFLCRYDDSPESDAVRFDPVKELITVNRTEAIDAMMESIRDLANLPLRAPPARYKEQLKSLKRRIVEDTKGRPRKVYVATGTQGDDYAHAEVYDLVASEMSKMLSHAEQEWEEGEPSLVSSPGDGDGLDYDPGFGE